MSCPLSFPKSQPDSWCQNFSNIPIVTSILRDDYVVLARGNCAVKISVADFTNEIPPSILPPTPPITSPSNQLGTQLTSFTFPVSNVLTNPGDSVLLVSQIRQKWIQMLNPHLFRGKRTKIIH